MSNTTALDIEQICVPDTQERYPSEETYSSWWRDALNQSSGNYSVARFMVNKACEWQREQDALICLKTSEPACDCPTCETRRDCASDIRTPPQPGAAQ